MARHKRVRSRKYERDPLVALDHEVLQALAAERGLGSTALARVARQRQQTVEYHLKIHGIGECRSSLRAALAKALDVPDGLLSGDPIPIPFIPLAEGPYEFLHTRRTRLAASRLIQDVILAVEKDVRAMDASSSDLHPRLPARILAAQVVQQVGELIRVGEWRRRLMEWEPEALAARGYSEPPTVDTPGQASTVPFDAAHEEAILGLIRGIAHVLRPWIDRQAQLNYRVLRDLTELPGHPFVGAEEAYSPFDPNSIVQPFAPGSRPVPPEKGGTK